MPIIYYKTIIEKYHDSSFSIVPSGFKKEFIRLRDLPTDVMGRKIQDTFPATANAVGVGTIGLHQEVYESIVTRCLTEAFIECEKDIKNSRMFWFLYLESHLNAQIFDRILDVDKRTEILTRYDRTDITLEQRQQSVSMDCELQGKNAKKENKVIWDYLKKFKTDDDVILYRGFTISKDEDVRKGRLKIGNPNAYQQQSGTGISFTISEDVAKFFVHQLIMIDGSLISFVANTRDDTCGIIKEPLSKEYKDNIKKEWADKTSRRVVAKYSVKKKDILFWCDYIQEREVVTLPESTKLLSYKLSPPKLITSPSMKFQDIGFLEDWEVNEFKKYKEIDGKLQIDFNDVFVEEKIESYQVDGISQDVSKNDMLMNLIEFAKYKESEGKTFKDIKSLEGFEEFTKFMADKMKK